MLSSVFMLSPFLGDITRFFESDAVFKTREVPVTQFVRHFKLGSRLNARHDSEGDTLAGRSLCFSFST